MANNMTTPPIRVSFPTLFTPRSIGDGAPSYSIVAMFDKKSVEQMAYLKSFKQACDKILTEEWPDPATRPRIPTMGHDKSVIKDGDTALNQQGVPLSEKNPEYAGHYIVRAATYSSPPIVVGPGGASDVIVDKNKVYGGCWCQVNMNPYARKRKDNPGISCGLNGVQFVRNGDSFGGGRPQADDMFSPVEGGDTGFDDFDPFGA